MSQNTREAYLADVARATEEEHNVRERDADFEKAIHKRNDKLRKASQNARQQKRRQKRHDAEIKAGVRDANGKRKTPPQNIADVLQGPSGNKAERERQRLDLAEQSRPKRAIEETLHQSTRKPQGRKRKHEWETAKYVNWHSPFLWPAIERAALHPSVGLNMSTTRIKDVLVRVNPDSVYGRLNRSTIEGWIDRTGTRPHWSEAALAMAAKGHIQGGHGGFRGYLAGYPDVVQTIVNRLEALRKAHAPLTLVSIRAITVASILREAPEVFERKAPDGSTFRCSDSFLRRFLHEQLHWSERRATRDGRKLPKDWEEQCQKAFFRLVHDVKEYDVPSELIINSDQTNMIYAQGTKMTWAPTGSSQVSVIGVDEKRAVTVVVSVANSGTLLPFQAVYQGETYASTPKASAPHYTETTDAGFRYEYGTKGSYWSTQRTMQSLVNDILAPYFAEQKRLLRYPEDQKSVWQIDIWSVHRSEEFRTWLFKTHPTILLHFVPGGCTPILQACDVGMQRLLKHSLKRSYHEDVVNDMLDQLDQGEETLTTSKRVGILRDRSVGWLWKAYTTLNKKEIVCKVSRVLMRVTWTVILQETYRCVQAFQMCAVGDFNLSYGCLTDKHSRAKLREYKAMSPEFRQELDLHDQHYTVQVSPEGVCVEDEELAGDGDDTFAGDDVDIPCDTLIAHVLSGVAPPGAQVTEQGCLVSTAKAEGEDDVAEAVGEEELGRGKRKRRARDLAKYNGEHFWRH